MNRQSFRNMLVLFSHPDFTGVSCPAVPALTGPAVAHAISWNRMWEEEQEIKWVSLFVTFYKISVPVFTSFSPQQHLIAREIKKRLLGDTWTRFALYIEVQFLSEYILFNPFKILCLGLVLPFRDFFFFFIICFSWQSNKPGFVKGLLPRSFEGQPVFLPAGLNTPGWLAAGGSCSGKYHITLLRQTFLLLNLLFLPCCLTGLGALTSSVTHADQLCQT